jgi:hypothetical protein
MKPRESDASNFNVIAVCFMSAQQGIRSLHEKFGRSVRNGARVVQFLRSRVEMARRNRHASGS